jgi:uncharacterized protein YigE (DUF2233 family)
MNLRQLSYLGTSFTVATVDLAHDSLHLLWKDARGQRIGSLEGAEAWATAQKKKLLMATNAGIFAPGYVPLGLHVSEGKTLVKLNQWHGGGNFFLAPNGVFAVVGKRAGVWETGEFAKLTIKPRLATQSGPLLVQGGKLHPKFTKGSANKNIRSGVGVARDGKVVFVLSQLPVNFYDFASLFRDTLGCPNALYLDGAISGMLCPGTALSSTGSDDFAGIFAVVKENR